MFLPKDQLDCFPIRKDIFTKESDFNPLDYFVNGHDLKHIHSVNASRNVDQLVPIPTKDTFCTLKPQLLSYNNAYISEQFWVFDENKNIVQEALAENYNVHGYELFDAYPENSIKPTLINNIKKSKLEKKYGKNNLFVHYAMLIPLIKKHIKEFPKNFFNDPNTVHVRVPLNVISIFDQYYANFGHFLMEMFPAFYYWWTRLPDEERSKLYIPYPQKRSDVRYDVWNTNIWPLLKLMGIQKKQLLPIDHGKIYQFNKVLVPQKTKYNDKIVQPALNFIKKSYLNLNTTNKYKDYKRIFINRKAPAFGRMIINKEEVQCVLSKYHIKTISFEDYTYEEKINILNNTEFMIGNSGSNIFNLLLTNNNINCVIFDSMDWIHMDLYTSLIAYTKNVFITILMCKSINEDNDFIVDIDKLDQKLSKILKD